MGMELQQLDWLMTHIDEAVQEWLNTKLLAGSKRRVTVIDENGEEHTEVVSRTVREYQSHMQNFRAFLALKHLDLCSNPIDITRLANIWASIRNEEGQKRHPRNPVVSSTTYSQRLASISSWYTFVQKKYKIDLPNPIKDCEKRKVHPYAAAVPLDPTFIQERLDQIDRATVVGLRDYAVLAVGLGTGHRVKEIAALRWRDVTIRGNAGDERIELAFLGKGEKPDRKALDSDQSAVFLEYILTQYEGRLATLPEDAPIWVSYSRRNAGEAVDTKTLENICKERLGTSKFHTLRHNYVEGLLKLGVDITVVSRLVGHSDVRVTMLYANSVLQAENPYSPQLTARFGIKRAKANQ